MSYDAEIGRLEQGRAVVRTDPVRLTWRLEDLISKDGQSIQAEFTCSARALASEAEQRMFAEVFLAGRKVTTARDVVEHFRSALRTAAASACKDIPADALVDGEPAAVLQALRAAADRVAFSCGLELLPPFQLRMQSPTLEKQRVEAMQRNLAEQRAAGQLEHLQRASELLRQFESIRQSAPQLSPGQILSQLNPADQGALLQTLMLAEAQRNPTAAVWAVAGSTLLKIDPQRDRPTARPFELPANLGPLRSVQCITGQTAAIAVGARSGVLLCDPDQPERAQELCDASVTSQLGFSRVVRWREQIWACHSEAGIVGWKLDHPTQPLLAMRPVDLAGASPRNLQVLDDSRLIFSSQDRVLTLGWIEAPDQMKLRIEGIALELRSEVIAILPMADRLLIVLNDGRVQVRARTSLELEREERIAAALLPWLGTTRLLVATEDGPVLCVGLDDPLVTQYLSPHRGIRVLAAAADLIIGLSADRQRILLWRPWNARQLAGDIFVSAVARHRAADVDL
jgi:hypothetical protein